MPLPEPLFIDDTLVYHFVDFACSEFFSYHQRNSRSIVTIRHQTRNLKELGSTCGSAQHARGSPSLHAILIRLIVMGRLIGRVSSLSVVG